MKKSNALSVLIALSLLLAACTGAGNENANPGDLGSSPDGERVIVLGDISDDPAEVIEGAQPLADQLALALSDYGVTEGEVKVAKSTDEMIALLKNGEVDVIFDSTYPATLISDATGGSIVLRRWRFGVEEYGSVIFASKASGIKSINDLKGKMIAMDAPYSTSGFMLPAVYLTENGLDLHGKKASNEPVPANQVGFVFAYDDENILQWVLSGLTPAGVTDDYNYDTAFPREAIEKLVELARTEKTPRQVVVFRPGLDPEYAAAIKAALINMNSTPDGQVALKNFQTEKFDEFPEGIEAATARIREMMMIVKGIPLP